MTQLSVEQRRWQQDSEVDGPNFAVTGDGTQMPRLIAVGAVPLSAALCRMARAIHWTPYVIDPRAAFAQAERFPAAEDVLADWPADAFARLGGLDDRTAVVALTHAPELDDVALSLALASDVFYVGALGSRRTQAGRRDRLLAAGLTQTQLGRLRGPAGLDLGGDTIDEAALSILAEAVAARHDRGGAPLSTSASAIHAGRRP